MEESADDAEPLPAPSASDGGEGRLDAPLGRRPPRGAARGVALAPPPRVGVGVAERRGFLESWWAPHGAVLAYRGAARGFLLADRE